MYYIVSIQKMKDETRAQSVFGYATKEEALSVYHSTLASNYISETLALFAVSLLNEHGAVEAHEYWEMASKAEV